MSELLDQYNEAKQQAKDLLMQMGKPIISEILSPAARIKGVEGFTWTQYTPYFNDGEACTFGLGELLLITDDPDGTLDGPYDGVDFNTRKDELVISEWGNMGTGSIDVADPENYEILKKLASDFQNLDSEIFETIFGDHIWVEVRFEDDNCVYTVHDYNHD